MPLAFNSLSHGQIAFGFFNIDTDMLLLDRYFLFADKFCNSIIDMIDHQGQKNYTGNWHVYLIENTGHTFGCVHPFDGTNEKFDKLLNKTNRYFRANLK